MRLPSATRVVAALAVLTAGAAAGYFVRPYVEHAPRSAPSSQTDHRADMSRPVSALARLQPKDGVIPVYGPPGDRIAELSAGVVGKRLRRGDEIAKLASRNVRETEVAVAKLQLSEAQEQLARLKAAGRAKIAAARLEADQAAADEEKDKETLNLQIAVLSEQQEFAAGQLKALERIVSEGVRVSDEERKQARLLVSKSKAELDAARIKLAKAVAGYARVRELANAKIAAAEAELAEATARVPLASATKRVELAEQLRDLTAITAPVDGTVVKVVSHAGDPTGAHQPILYLADTTNMVAVAEVYETDAPRLWDGLSRGRIFIARVSSPVLPGGTSLTGRVYSTDQVTRMIARNAIFALNPREDTDRRVIEVTVELDAASTEVATHFIGLQVNIELTPAGEK